MTADRLTWDGVGWVEVASRHGFELLAVIPYEWIGGAGRGPESFSRKPSVLFGGILPGAERDYQPVVAPIGAPGERSERGASAGSGGRAQRAGGEQSEWGASAASLILGLTGAPNRWLLRSVSQGWVVHVNV